MEGMWSPYDTNRSHDMQSNEGQEPEDNHLKEQEIHRESIIKQAITGQKECTDQRIMSL